MSSDLQIRFQLGAHTQEVGFKVQDSMDKNSVLIGGISYSLKGNEEAISFVKECLAQLPQSSTETLEQTGKELKARLWQAGAKEIKLSTEGIHKIGVKILGDIELLDLHKTVDDIGTLLEKIYIFPDKAKKCSDYLRSQLQEGVYNSISDPETLAQVLTSDLRLITEDKHIFIDFNQPKLAQNSLSAERTTDYPIPTLIHSYTYKSDDTSIPYEIKSGFLKENAKVGYVDFRVFGFCREKVPDTKIAKAEKHLERLKEQRDHTKKGSAGRAKKRSLNEQIGIHEQRLEKLKLADQTDVQQEVAVRRKEIIAAIQNVKKAESIVIDLRDNGGGDPAAVQLMCSLFIDENLPLNRIQWRKGDTFEFEEFNTLTNNDLSANKRLLEQRVVVLIGPNTFSAAEEFINNMKVLGRATIVGEPSGGGANPGGMHQIGKEFIMFIPSGQAINPIQEGNWEGIGIIPDHVVPAKDALEQAMLLI